MLAYASVWNSQTATGTISAEGGYFSLDLAQTDDTLVFRFLGYYTIARPADQLPDTLDLYPSTAELGTVTVTPGQQDWLIDLIRSCIRQRPRSTGQSKAYYELKTYRDALQVELIEGYANASSRGYDLTELNLKAARLGLRPYSNRYFVSLEGTRALTLMRLFRPDLSLPRSPLEMSRRTLRKAYNLTVEQRVLTEAGDSLLVVRGDPRTTHKDLFSFRLWINPQSQLFHQVDLTCTDCQTHPFRALFPIDRITGVDLRITRTYEVQKERVRPRSTVLGYEIQYVSRVDSSYSQNYTIRSQALVWCYDHDYTFLLPFFDWPREALNDYRQINAIPYNTFFWNNHNEIGLSDRTRANRQFLDDPATQTNRSIFQKMSLGADSVSLFSSPFVHWSATDRIFFNSSEDSLSIPEGVTTQADRYRLDIEIFLDVNDYRDSLHLQTATILDPYSSYYRLPLTPETHAFINMAFDLGEIQRRNLVNDLLTAPKPDREQIQRIYERRKKALAKDLQTFQREVQRGTYLPAMQRWNRIIQEALGLDNLTMFRIGTNDTDQQDP